MTNLYETDENRSPRELAELRNMDRARIEKLEKRLNAYQKAFNSIDDMSEYKTMTRQDFEGVAANLSKRLRDIEDEYTTR